MQERGRGRAGGGLSERYVAAAAKAVDSRSEQGMWARGVNKVWAHTLCVVARACVVSVCLA